MRQLKSKWLGARIDDNSYDKIIAYIDTSTDIDGMGDLLRRAVMEYLANHPIKSTQEI